MFLLWLNEPPPAVYCLNPTCPGVFYLHKKIKTNKKFFNLIFLSGLLGKGVVLEANRGLILWLRLFTDLSKWWGCKCAATLLCYYRSGSPRWAGHPQCVRLCACVNNCPLLICAALSSRLNDDFVQRVLPYHASAGDETKCMWRGRRKTSSVSTTFQSISLGSDRDVWPQEAQHVIPLCVFQVWAWVKRRLITEWPLHRWQITREPTAFSRHPLRCCPGASCLPHPETPPEVSQSSWCMNSDLQLRMINQLHSEMVHEVIVEQSDNFKNISVHVTPTGAFDRARSHALWVVERHFGK